MLSHGKGTVKIQVHLNKAWKNAELKDYMYATAFEGLIGYLYLTKNTERLKYILDLCLT